MKNDYFKFMEQQMAYCVEASEFLKHVFLNYSPEKIAEEKQNMHAIENKADDWQHFILTQLYREFITPIDQEDIMRLVQIIDDVTDALDEVVLELYMFHIETMPKDGLQLLEMVDECIHVLHKAMEELKYFKKPEKLRTYLVKVGKIEREVDYAYADAVHRLFQENVPGKIIMGNQAIYESLENCCDLCKLAADVIEQTILKNL